jgi:hypothetical protein
VKTKNTSLNAKFSVYQLKISKAQLNFTMLKRIQFMMVHMMVLLQFINSNFNAKTVLLKMIKTANLVMFGFFQMMAKDQTL